MNNERQPLNILVVYAHPADSAWEGAGTLARPLRWTPLSRHKMKQV